MSISNIEQGYGAIACDDNAMPKRSSWRRTLVALAAASVVVVGATAAYSAHTTKATNLGALRGIDWDAGSFQKTMCISLDPAHPSPEIMDLGDVWLVTAKLRTGPASQDPMCSKDFYWDTVEMHTGDRFKNDHGRFKKEN